MERSSQPDVSRVLTKMGRADFGYRNFQKVSPGSTGTQTGPRQATEPTEAGLASATDNVPSNSAPTSAASMFRLLGASLPEAAAVVVAAEFPQSLVPTADAPSVSDPPAEPLSARLQVVPPTLKAVPEPVRPEATAPANDRRDAPAQERPSPLEAMPADRAVAPAVLWPVPRAVNPFPPRKSVVSPLAGAVTPMATVFRVLAGSESHPTSPSGRARTGAGFPFRRE
jgi:hypothetical protein